MKAYTDLEQSKKLAEILPLESADACWTNHLYADLLSSWRVESTPLQEYKCYLDRFVVKGYLIEPAWSLAALLDILKYPSLTQDVENKWSITDWTGAYPKSGYDFDSPVDACVEMINKLNELKMLR